MTLLYTCGDPLSINIEAFLRAVVPAMARHRAVVGIGSRWQLTHQAEVLGLALPSIQDIASPLSTHGPGVYWYDPSPDAPKVDARYMTELDRGRLAKAALDSVPDRVPTSLAVMTAPINKKAITSAGFQYPGQTEFFESRWGAKAVMMLAGPQLRVALVTNHLRLADVPAAISSKSVFEKIMIIHQASQNIFGLKRPRIAVCGLNPHCGDGGLFGNEDDTAIEPAVKNAMRMDVDVHGPYPADTVFWRALRGEFDVVLAMYHDQGLGPLKVVHFDDAVNVSLGLPHLRVSPDHGPAADLYLTGRASIKSFDAATKICERWLAQ
jgi:4-hydroxythreonine-4-phosphate dehydrogenase